MEKTISVGLCTSGSRLIVAVEADGKVKAFRRKLFSQETALFPALKKLLSSGKKISDIGEVCALKGPGRFTGIRIGLTVAGTLNALSGATVRTATVFDVLACQASDSTAFARAFPSGGRTVVLLHAFREEYFCAVYNIPTPGALPELVEAPVWLQRTDMEKKLSGMNTFFCIADEKEKAEIYSLLPRQAVRAPKKISFIMPEYLVSAPRRYGTSDLKPLYLTPAKIELDAMEKPAKAATAERTASALPVAAADSSSGINGNCAKKETHR